MTQATSPLRHGFKIFHSGCFRLFAFAWVALQGLTPAQAGDVLRFCFESADVRPWRNVDATGLNFELVNSAARQMALQVEYHAIPWKRCLAEVKSNYMDGALGASFEVDRLTVGMYPGGHQPDASKRLHMDTYVVVRRKGSNVRWDGKAFGALDGMVGIQLGYSIGEQLKSMHVSVDDGSLNVRELVLKLIAGRVSVAAMLGSQVRSLVKTDAKLANEIDILPIPLVEKPYYLMLSHNLMNEKPDLANRLWKNIEKERGSARYRKIEDEALKILAP
jgi:polar amino acid transport system substrate-binding protein